VPDEGDEPASLHRAASSASCLRSRRRMWMAMTVYMTTTTMRMSDMAAASETRVKSQPTRQR